MIKINSELWRVLLVSPYHPGLRKQDGGYALGCCNNKNKTIYINEEVNPHLLRKILTHELTHAAMFSYNIELSYDQEELVADLIATYGHEIIHMTNLIFKRLQEQI